MEDLLNESKSSNSIEEIENFRPSIGSDADYDDDLEVSNSIKIVDMGEGPIAIENSEDETEGTLIIFVVVK